MKKIFSILLAVTTSFTLASCSTPMSGSYLLSSGKPMQKIDPISINVQALQYKLAANDVLLVQVHPLELVNAQHKIEKGNQLRISFNYDKNIRNAYKIVAGDELSLEFPEEVEASFKVIVNPDGKITLPRVGKNIMAAGLSVAELNKISLKEYNNLYISPKVSWGVVRAFSEQLNALSTNYFVGADGEIVVDRLGRFNVLGKLASQVETELAERATKYYQNDTLVNVSVAKVNQREQYDSRLTPSGLEMNLNPNNVPNKIAEDGTVYLPYLGDVEAQGKTVREFRDEITNKIQAQYQNPITVNVAIQEYADSNVFIGGEVRQPGRFPYSHKMSLLKLITMAGWGTEYADMGNVILIRASGENDYTIYRTNLDEVLSAKGPAAQDFKIAPQDLVVVLPTDVAKANRYVSQYIKGILPFGTSVSYNINNNPSSGN